ncbi:MAG: isopenicillin synthase [Gammaproteobacteria bacterium]|jgi:isopenicillin N synthase-like dioxygenase|nr:isopenicillin synthase [Gammaproteobacteria bacterium]
MSFDLLTVDFTSPNAGKEFTHSLHHTGFAVIKNHPLPADLVEEVYANCQNFFGQPEEYKRRYIRHDVPNRGYFPPLSENAKYSNVKDLKEFYHYFNDPEYLPKEFGQNLQKLYQEMHAIASKALSWIEDNLPAHLREALCMPLKDMIVNSDRTLIRLIHYPPLTGNEEENAVRAAAHEDIGMLTFLPAATAKGLQVKDSQGNWHEVPCDHGTIAVNTGDTLTAITQGYLPATTHCVVNPDPEMAKTSRFSMPLFLHPQDDVRLPDGRTAKDYLMQRLKEIGLA